MKPFLKSAILAAAGVALATVPGQAQNNFNQGDLILGLSEPGHNDLMLDIGPVSTYLNTTATINLDTIVASAGNPTYTTLSSLINHTFGGTTGLSWSVAGATKAGAAVTTFYSTDPSTTITAISQAKLSLAGGTYVGTYANVYATATSGNTLVQNLAVDTAPSVAGTYTKEAPLVNGQLPFDFESNTPSTAGFYMFTPGNAGQQANGSFEIDSSGNGSFIVVAPEPGTMGILGLGAVLILFVNRKFKRQQV